jgi:hypothetical protein
MIINYDPKSFIVQATGQKLVHSVFGKINYCGLKHNSLYFGLVLVGDRAFLQIMKKKNCEIEPSSCFVNSSFLKKKKILNFVNRQIDLPKFDDLT